MIVTVYNEAIPQGVVDGQKKVFEKFGEEINQLKPTVWRGHAWTLDNCLTYTKWDHAIIFDIDCIPLNKDVVKDAREWILKNKGIYSVAQNPNHIPNAVDYASPAFIAFSYQTYEELGKPSFQGSNEPAWDVAGEFTYKALQKNIPLKLMYPSHIEIPKWKFANGSMFGIGTTYEYKIYHHFEGRRITRNFIDKCNKILNDE